MVYSYCLFFFNQYCPLLENFLVNELRTYLFPGWLFVASVWIQWMGFFCRNVLRHYLDSKIHYHTLRRIVIGIHYHEGLLLTDQVKGNFWIHLFNIHDISYVRKFITCILKKGLCSALICDVRDLPASQIVQTTYRLRSLYYDLTF